MVVAMEDVMAAMVAQEVAMAALSYQVVAGDMVDQVVDQADHQDLGDQVDHQDLGDQVDHQDLEDQVGVLEDLQLQLVNHHRSLDLNLGQCFILNLMPSPEIPWLWRGIMPSLL